MVLAFVLVWWTSPTLFDFVVLFLGCLWCVFSVFVFLVVRCFQLCVCGFKVQKCPCDEYALTAGADLFTKKRSVTLLHSYENFDYCVLIEFKVGCFVAFA